MPSPFAFELRVIDVDGQLISDPTIFVRVANDARSVMARAAFAGAPVPIRFDDRPAGDVLRLRLTPTRYHDSQIFCPVNGDGTIVPDEIQIPRRSSEWLPAFARWNDLPGSFDLLKTKLADSMAFRLGRASNAGRFVEGAYDAVEPDDESSNQAKMSLLNLYSRLGTESAPGASEPWFSYVNELCYAARERLVAEVSEECFTRVRDLSREKKGDYRGVKVVNSHIENIKAVEPGAVEVSEAASVKTGDKKANIQLTVARATRGGRSVFLLDTDMDENGRLILHAFDVIRHAFNGGTHPIDIAEALRKMFPKSSLGYALDPRRPVPETTARLVM